MSKEMKFKVILIGLVFSLGCADKKRESIQTTVEDKTVVASDTFKREGHIFFKEYFGEGGNLVTEEDKTYFEKDDHDEILVQVKLKTLNSRLVDVPDYKLNLTAYKSTAKKYDKTIWQINIEGQAPVGIWGDFKKYYKTADYGCCSTEDGYRLYDLQTGKYFLSHTGDLQYINYPTWNYTGYQARLSTTFDSKSSKAIIGNLYYIEIDANSDKTVVNTYDVYCENRVEDIRFLRTPKFEIKAKEHLKTEGFFQQFNLFKDGQQITQLDTAEYYLVLEYDTKLRVLTPVDKELVPQNQLATDLELSKDLHIKRR